MGFYLAQTLSYVSLTLVQKGRNHFAKQLNGSLFYQANFNFDYPIKCNECYGTKSNHGMNFFSESAPFFTCSTNINASKFMCHSKNQSMYICKWTFCFYKDWGNYLRCVAYNRDELLFKKLSFWVWLNINETCYKTGRVSTRDFTVFQVMTPFWYDFGW